MALENLHVIFLFYPSLAESFVCIFIQFINVTLMHRQSSPHTVTKKGAVAPVDCILQSALHSSSVNPLFRFDADFCPLAISRLTVHFADRPYSVVVGRSFFQVLGISDRRLCRIAIHICEVFSGIL